jgi:histone-lysine N-methyltransferase SETD1
MPPEDGALDVNEFFPDRASKDESSKAHDEAVNGELENGVEQPSRGYKLVYDPDLSRDRSKGSKPIYNEIKGGGKASDPRKKMDERHYRKAAHKGKKSAFGSLPIPKFSYDANSVSDPPPTQILISKLSALSTKPTIATALRMFGELESIDIIQDPTTAASLGLCHARFQSSKGIVDAHAIAEKVVKQSGTLRIDMVPVVVEFDDKGKKAKAITDKILARKEKEEAKILEEERKKAKEARAAEAEKERKREREREREMKKERERERELERQREKERERERQRENMARRGSTKPYIFMNRKHVPTTGEIQPSFVDRVLKNNQHRPEYVTKDSRGFYIVFKRYRDAYDCYKGMDGKRLARYRFVMELVGVPEDRFSNDMVPQGRGPRDGKVYQRAYLETDPVAKKLDPVAEATNILSAELKRLLWKDVKERSIAPAVFENLNPNRFKKLKEETEQNDATSEPAPQPDEGSNAASVASVQPLKLSQLPSLPKFKKRNETVGSSKLKTKTTKRDLRPLNHALNYDSEEEASESAPSTRKGTPSVEPSSKKRKKGVPHPKTLDYTSSEEDDTVESPPDKKLKSEQPEESDNDAEMQDAPGATVKQELTLPLSTTLAPENWEPTSGPYPLTVCEDKDIDVNLGISDIKELIKDSEDWELVKEVLSSVKRKPVENINFWTWNRLQIESDNAEFDSKVTDPDFLPKPTDNVFSSFKSKGYSKIPEADKAEYLPLRRRREDKPVDTLEHNDRETTNSNLATERGGESSRNNRLNLRKLEKQVLETDVMSVNSLKKRKKPVKYARSSIHNWGLYAVEPIAAGEMIIEYVGEIIRSELSDVREREYLRSGIGSSYLFRVDGETVIDATKKGGIARVSFDQLPLTKKTTNCI